MTKYCFGVLLAIGVALGGTAQGLAPADAQIQPSWISLMSSNPARSAAFYSEVFGWKATQFLNSKNWVLSLDGKPLIDIEDSAATGSHTVVYFLVSDIWAAYSRALDLGATSIYAPCKQSFSPFTVAQFKDLDGNSVGVEMNGNAGPLCP